MNDQGPVRALRGIDRGRRGRRRIRAVVLVAALIAGLGTSISYLPPLIHAPVVPEEQEARQQSKADAYAEPGVHAAEAVALELRRRFDEAVVMLHAREYEHAVTALHRVLALKPDMPEGHVNMGFALLGLTRPDAARDFFRAAIDLNPGQANAYYGLAVAHESLRELPEAMGAMRTYLHLSRPDESHRRQARAALWEWEAQITRAGTDSSGSDSAARRQETTHD